MMTRLSHQTDQKGKRNKAKAKEVKDGIDAALKEGIRSRGAEGRGARTGEQKRVDVTITHTDAPLLSTERHWDLGTKIRPPVSPLNRPEQRTNDNRLENARKRSGRRNLQWGCRRLKCA
jgi:hypothetical protein